MLTQEQKKKLYLLMEELPKYLQYGTDESKQKEKLSYLAELIHSDDSVQENLYNQIFIEKSYPKDYGHPSVFIKRFFDWQ